MSTIRSINRDNTTFCTGIRTAALIVIIGIVAAIADHALFAPRVSAQGAERQAAPTIIPADTGAFGVPDHLRAHAAEVPAHIEGF